MSASPRPPRAWVRLAQRAAARPDLSPTPFDWTDEDLAIGLARTYRWGGHSIWPGAPLSVAQHSLTVLALRQAAAPTGLSARAQLRELLHDADEGLINFDCISPLKPFLGPAFAALEARLADAIATRYALPPWTAAEKHAHKVADIAAAAHPRPCSSPAGRGPRSARRSASARPSASRTRSPPATAPNRGSHGHPMLPWNGSSPSCAH